MTATPQAVAAAEARLCEELIGVDAYDCVVVHASDLRLVLEDNTRLNRLRNDLAKLVHQHASELTGKPEPMTISNPVFIINTVNHPASDKP